MEQRSERYIFMEVIMRMDRRFIKGSLAAALMLSAVLAAGCGNGSDASGSSEGGAATTTTVAASNAETEAAVSQPEENISDEKEPPKAVFTENIVGTEGEYGYELWKDRGDTTFTLGEGGAFSCEWKNINNALFRRGQKFDCTKTYEEFIGLKTKY